MPIRIPFTRRPNAPEVNDETERPGLAVPKVSNPGFERVETMGSRASSVLSIRTSKSRDNGDYKMSGTCNAGEHLKLDAKTNAMKFAVVNDSGVYLPV